MPSVLMSGNGSNQQEIPTPKKRRIDGANDVYNYPHPTHGGQLEKAHPSNRKSSNQSPTNIISSSRAINANFGNHHYFQSSNFPTTSDVNQQQHAHRHVQHHHSKESIISDSGLGYLMIGEEVQVRNAEGRMEAAMVRYYRPGTGYKIQFADGHFEWLNEQSVLEMKQQMSNPNFKYQRKTPLISSTIDPHNINVNVPQLPQITYVPVNNGASTGYKRAPPPGYNSQNYSHLTPFSPKRAEPLNASMRYNNESLHHQQDVKRQHLHHDAYFHSGMRGVVANDGASRRQRPMNEMRKASLGFPNDDKIASTKALNDSNAAEQFYCAVCDHFVSQEQMTFIVVRIPACHTCSTSKIAILDENEDSIERGEVDENGSESNLERPNQKDSTANSENGSKDMANVDLTRMKSEQFDVNELGESRSVNEDSHLNDNLQSSIHETQIHQVGRESSSHMPTLIQSTREDEVGKI